MIINKSGQHPFSLTIFIKPDYTLHRTDPVLFPGSSILLVSSTVCLSTHQVAPLKTLVYYISYSYLS